MRKNVICFLTILFICNSLYSQRVMKIEKNDGSTIVIEAKEINRVFFETETNTHNGYEYVDLGLSVKWASRNIGALDTHDYGNYYAWGETSTKSIYSGYTYKWYDGVMYSDGNTTLWYNKKYNCSPFYGTVDGKISLDPEDDVAHKSWGGLWRMPTGKEVDELIENCSFEWTSSNGIKGAKFTGPNGRSIFLPAAGIKVDSGHVYIGVEGNYWTATFQDSVSENNPHGAYPLFFNNYNCYKSNTSRHYGAVIRPVCP